MNGRQRLKQMECISILTSKYIFTIPIKTSSFLIVPTEIRQYDLFRNKSIAQGLNDLIEAIEDVDELEMVLIKLLNNDPKCVYLVSNANTIKAKAFLGQITMKYVSSKQDFVTITAKKRAVGKEMRVWAEDKYASYNL